MDQLRCVQSWLSTSRSTSHTRKKNYTQYFVKHFLIRSKLDTLTISPSCSPMTDRFKGNGGPFVSFVTSAFIFVWQHFEGLETIGPRGRRRLSPPFATRKKHPSPLFPPLWAPTAHSSLFNMSPRNRSTILLTLVEYHLVILRSATRTVSRLLRSDNKASNSSWVYTSFNRTSSSCSLRGNAILLQKQHDS